MRPARTKLRPLSRHTLRVGFAGGAAAAIVCLTTSPALAATTVSVSSGGSNLSDGAVVSENATLTAKGSSDATAASRQLRLSVSVPGQGDYTLKTGSAGPLQSGSLTATVDLGCPDWSSSPCVEAVNGTYRFSFKAGSAASSSSVQLRVPPAPPSGFDASVSGTVASFTWSANSEPDILGYDIVEGGSNDVTPGGVDSGSVCDASGCGVSIDFGAGARGTTHSFSVIARRHTSPGSGGYVASGASASKTVTFAAPPSPSSSPSDSPGASGGGGGGTGGGGSSVGRGGGGGGAVGAAGGSRSDRARRLSGKHPAADLRSSLPTLTAAGAPDLPSLLTEVKPLPQGN